MVWKSGAWYKASILSRVAFFSVSLSLSLCTTRLQDGCTRLVKHNLVKIDLRKYIITMLDCFFNLIWASLKSIELFYLNGFLVHCNCSRVSIVLWHCEILEFCMVLPICVKNSASRKAFVNGINYTWKVQVTVSQWGRIRCKICWGFLLLHF